MKTNINIVAAYAASAIWADGFYDDVEKDILSEIADVCEFDSKELVASVEAELAKIKNLSEEEVTNNLCSLGKNVCAEDKDVILECILEIIIADGVISSDEVTNVLAIAEALGIEEEKAVLMLADLVKDEPELEIKL